MEPRLERVEPPLDAEPRAAATRSCWAFNASLCCFRLTITRSCAFFSRFCSICCACVIFISCLSICLISSSLLGSMALLALLPLASPLLELTADAREWSSFFSLFSFCSFWHLRHHLLALFLLLLDDLALSDKPDSGKAGSSLLLRLLLPLLRLDEVQGLPLSFHFLLSLELHFTFGMLEIALCSLAPSLAWSKCVLQLLLRPADGVRSVASGIEFPSAGSFSTWDGCTQCSLAQPLWRHLGSSGPMPEPGVALTCASPWGCLPQ